MMPDKDHNESDAVQELDRFLDRIKELHEEAEETKVSMREEYTIMKSKGFDQKALRKLVALARETKEQREKRHETEAVLELYKDATNVRG